jgi:hypothetical protein
MTQRFDETAVASDDRVEPKEPALEPDPPLRPRNTMWFRFPRLRRQKGLATGIIGLW